MVERMQTSIIFVDIKSSHQRRHATSDKKRLRQGNRFAVVCKVSFHFLKAQLNPNSENKFVLRHTHFNVITDDDLLRKINSQDSINQMSDDVFAVVADDDGQQSIENGVLLLAVAETRQGSPMLISVAEE